MALAAAHNDSLCCLSVRQRQLHFTKLKIRGKISNASNFARYSENISIFISELSEAHDNADEIMHLVFIIGFGKVCKPVCNVDNEDSSLRKDSIT